MVGASLKASAYVLCIKKLRSCIQFADLGNVLSLSLLLFFILFGVHLYVCICSPFLSDAMLRCRKQFWSEVLAGLGAQSSGSLLDFIMAENIIARCSEILKLDYVEDALVNGMLHNVCGPVNICIFRRELGENTKMEGGLTFCNMFIKANGKNWVVPAYEFPFNYLEDRTSVEYEPVCSDTDDRFIPDYRFDVSKLEPSAAKLNCADNSRALARAYKDVKIDRRKKVEVPTYLTQRQTTHKAWMDKNIASKSPDQVERFVSRYLRKLAVILLPVLVELLAWVSLETLTLTLLHLRYVPLSQTGTGWGTKNHRSIHLT